jgi:hypothetical protein
MTMTDTRPTATGQRDRSPSFPFIPLKTAIERLIAFEEYHKRSSMPPDRVGPAWGMKPKTSQAAQTLAALKAYGLLETQRGDAGRAVVVSDDGRTYLRAQQDNVKQEVLRRAALHPKQIETYWRDWKDDRPADAACLDALVLGGGFSQDGAEKFLRVYDATIAYAGLADSDKEEADDAAAMVDDGQDDDPPAPTVKTVPVARGSSGVRIMEGERVVFTEEADPQRYIKLVAAGEVDETLLDALTDYVKRQRKRLGLPSEQIPIKKPVAAPAVDDDGEL